jgi:hypothetical protein
VLKPLIKQYQGSGYKSVAAECARYGVREDYIHHVAAQHGVKRDDWHDHRWEWAKARGAVCV